MFILFLRKGQKINSSMKVLLNVVIPFIIPYNALTINSCNFCFVYLSKTSFISFTNNPKTEKTRQKNLYIALTLQSSSFRNITELLFQKHYIAPLKHYRAPILETLQSSSLWHIRAPFSETLQNLSQKHYRAPLSEMLEILSQKDYRVPLRNITELLSQKHHRTPEKHYRYNCQTLMSLSSSRQNKNRWHRTFVVNLKVKCGTFFWFN